MLIKMRILIISFLIPLFAAYSFVLDEKLSNYEMEKRAVNLFKIIKCLVCAGESLHESQSQLACNMRAIIREKISNGYSDGQIISDLRLSYGDQIINAPPLKINTYILWALPILIFLVGIVVIV